MDNPLISVVMPVYNVERFIEPCLNSVLAQTWPNFEVILVDDGSTDRSGQICDAFASRDTRIRVSHFPQNRGPSAARNEGVRRAAGNYTAFVDSDDYMEPGLLDGLYTALTETRADISICGAEGLRLKTGPAQVLSPDEAARCMARRALFLWTLWGKLFPAELAKQIPFDRNIHCGEDLLFFYRILKRVQRIAYVPDPLYHYVRREGSLVNHGVTEKRCTVFLALDWICADAAVDFPEAEACFRQAALDTAARLAMQAAEEGADGSVQDCLRRFHDHTRRHFSWEALALCPSQKSAAAQLALRAGVPVFGALAAVYKRAKSMKKNGME